MENNRFVEEQWHPVAVEAARILAALETTKLGRERSLKTPWAAVDKAAEILRYLFPMFICLNFHFPYRIIIGKEKSSNVSKSSIMGYLISLFIGVSNFFKAWKMKNPKVSAGFSFWGFDFFKGRTD